MSITTQKASNLKLTRANMVTRTVENNQSVIKNTKKRFIIVEKKLENQSQNFRAFYNLSWLTTWFSVPAGLPTSKCTKKSHLVRVN